MKATEKLARLQIQFNVGSCGEYSNASYGSLCLVEPGGNHKDGYAITDLGTSVEATIAGIEFGYSDVAVLNTGELIKRPLKFADEAEANAKGRATRWSGEPGTEKRTLGNPGQRGATPYAVFTLRLRNSPAGTRLVTLTLSRYGYLVLRNTRGFRNLGHTSFSNPLPFIGRGVLIHTEIKQLQAPGHGRTVLVLMQHMRRLDYWRKKECPLKIFKSRSPTDKLRA